MTRIHERVVLQRVVPVERVTAAIAVLQRQLQNPEGLLSQFSLLLSVPSLVLASPLPLARLVCATNESMHKVSVVFRSSAYFAFGRLACR